MMQTNYDIFSKFQRFPNIGEIQIWMQHITYKSPNPIAYTEDICKIVNHELGVKLWNNDWVDDAYKKDFPQYEICTDWIRDSFTPIKDIYNNQSLIIVSTLGFKYLMFLSSSPKATL